MLINCIVKNSVLQWDHSYNQSGKVWYIKVFYGRFGKEYDTEVINTYDLVEEICR